MDLHEFTLWDKSKTLEKARIQEEHDRKIKRLAAWLERLARLAGQSTPA